MVPPGSSMLIYVAQSCGRACVMCTLEFILIEFGSSSFLRNAPSTALTMKNNLFSVLQILHIFRYFPKLIIESNTLPPTHLNIFTLLSSLKRKAFSAISAIAVANSKNVDAAMPPNRVIESCMFSERNYIWNYFFVGVVFHCSFVRFRLRVVRHPNISFNHGNGTEN